MFEIRNWFISVAFITVCLMVVSGEARAVGEVLKLETSGLEACDDFVFQKFNKKNDVDLWIRVDGTFQITVSLTADFQEGTTFPMSGAFYFTKLKKAAFVFGAFFDDGSFATASGDAKIEFSGIVSKMKGIFVQDNLFGDLCFSRGKFKGKAQ